MVAFREAIFGAGLPVPEVVIPDGELHRFPTAGKSGNLDGWYVLHLDGQPAGAFGCWRTGLQETWHSGCRSSAVQRRAYQRSVLSLQKSRQVAEKDRYAEAARTADILMRGAKPASDDHPYLQNKRVRSYGLRQCDDVLLVPLQDEFGHLHNAQRIFPNGAKRYLKDGRKRACFFQIGDGNELIALVEGYATGATVYEALGWPVVVCFDCGNLEPVANVLRRVYPRERFVFLADNDRNTQGNPGVTKARQAAEKHGGEVWYPKFADDESGSDWNDLEGLRGMEAVEGLYDIVA